MRISGLVLFISIFLSLYGGMHYYIYQKISPLLPSVHTYVACIFLTFVVSPIVTQLLVKADWISLARVMAWIGYIWMGFAFVFFSFALILDVIRGTLWIAAKIVHVGIPLLPLLGSPQATYILLFGAMPACGYGAYSAKKINVTRIRFANPKMLQANAQFRIVQISDLHLGVLTSEARIQRMVSTINALQPDIVVSTGDLVDMQADHINKYAGILRGLHAKYGCYAVTGNHEAIAGIRGALAFIRDAGFTLLSGAGRQIDNRINIVGVDDPALTRNNTQSLPSEESILQAFQNGHVTILLKHRPYIDKTATAYFDLQLSGHVHGGQIFPFGLLTRLVYPIKMGMSQVAAATWLYVSYGSGTWGPPIRFLAPPEITVIDIVSTHNADS